MHCRSSAPSRLITYLLQSEIEPDEWSDSDEVDQDKAEEPKDLAAATRQIKALQRNLQQAKQDLAYYRQFVSERLNLAGLTDELQKGEGPSGSQPAAPPRDDDSHYFQSYAENGVCLMRISQGPQHCTLTPPQIFTLS